MEELQWQKLNAGLRIVMIAILLAIGLGLLHFGSLSHCDLCKFKDDRNNMSKTITCTEIMKTYAEAIKVNESNPISFAVDKALWDELNVTI